MSLDHYTSLYGLLKRNNNNIKTMVINMDTELQRLICLSVDKMTQEPGSSGSRKSRGLDLRKALLVAHVLQDMRTAYISDDYKILVNTVCPELSSENDVEKLKRMILRKQYEDCVSQDVIHPKKRKFFSDDWTGGAIERPPRSDCSETPFMTSPYRCPSGTQSCLLTCSDATMSKISQITHPIPVSINTSYVLSHQTSEKDENEDTTIEMDGETPAVSEQVEVTSSNDVEKETIETEEVIECQEKAEILMGDITTVKPLSDTTTTRGTPTSTSCPLPRKKRPLPKEYVDTECFLQQSPTKRTKFEVTAVTSSPCDVTVTSSSCYLHNTTTATTLTQSTALSSSRLSQSGPSPCSTTTSSVCTTSLVSSSTSTNATNSKPKVVVEMMHKSLGGLWSWSLPATCTQPRLSNIIIDSAYRTQLGDISNLRENCVRSAGLQVAY